VDDLDIFDLDEQCLKTFMDDFFIYGDTFEVCLINLGNIL